MSEPKSPQWWLPGMNVYRWVPEEGCWRQANTFDERPCAEALWLYQNLLLSEAEPSSYEWKEGVARYKMERWSDEALEVARRQFPLLFRVQ